MGPGAIRPLREGGLLLITYPKSGKSRGMTDLPAIPWWRRRDVLGEITGDTWYVAIAQVIIDESWTEPRFKRS